MLTNDLTSHLAGDVTLVLDDYHVITATPLHHAMIFLVEHCPPQLHLVLASRADPPLPLARLRARGQLSELRAALPAALSEDADVAVPALLELTRRMTATPLDGPALQRALSVPLSVPPRVRAALFQRDVESAEVLRAVDVPTLIVHGTADSVVDLRASEYAAGLIPHARTRWYEGVGHMPFVECVEDFTADLATFARSVTTTKAGS